MGERKTEYVTLKGTAIAETEAAVLILLDGDDAEEVWFPKSTLHSGSPVQGEGDHGDVIVAEWLAKKKGIIE